MIKPGPGGMRWLVGLIILVVAFFISACAPADQGIANQAPIISGLTTSPESVSPGGNTLLKCIASDRDGDKLSYSWSVNGDNIPGEGPAVMWVAPDTEGTYTVTVSVTDGRDGEATASVSIEVSGSG